ncbi:MAG: amino acid adenylation domain-containing protein [Oscillospiraceae bacterium]|nr:amino acid adenylation domain-containing protein [Oscillospiraceae bacterium]
MNTETQNTIRTYPLSASQMGIFTECMAHSGEALYNVPFLIRLDSAVDAERLCLACEKAVQAHPNMMTSIRLDETGTPVQYMSDDTEYHQTTEHMTEADIPSVRASFIRHFDLFSDRLFRIRIISTEKAVYLFLDTHHIITDGSSVTLFLGDIDRAYSGEELPAETYTGFDIALAEKNTPKEVSDKARQWYLDTFSGIEANSLPIPDVHGDTVSYKTYERDLGITDEQVKGFCRQHGIGRSVLACAAFGILAARYAAEGEALFTAIYNGRKSEDTARTFSMLVKTLPVYIQTGRQKSIASLLEELSSQLHGCRENDIYPFSELAHETGISSDLLFAYQGDSWKNISLCGQRVKAEVLSVNSTGSKLTVQLFKNGSSFALNAEYRADLYSDEFIQTMCRCYDNVIKGMLTAENVDDISLTDAEQLSALDAFNLTGTDYDRKQTVVSLFRAAAAAYPDNTAVIYMHQRITYRELDRLSDKIAAYILSLGIKGGVVSVLIPRGIYQAAASLGAAKAGCAYQPLDAAYPPERLTFMAGDAKAALIITTEQLCPLITEHNARVLYLSEIPSLPDGTPSADIAPDDTFVLLYTSGTTGTPKGVRLTHGNLVCFIDWYASYYALSSEDRVGQYASFGFDACMMDMFPALSYGAAVCIVPEDMRLDLPAMDKYYTDNRVSLAFFTTQVGRQFVTETKNPYLRAVSTGGEKLASMDPPENLDFYNVYGPTECTILTTVFKVTHREENIPIGRPIDNIKCYIVDMFGHRVPAGALGELLIAGPHVGAGYLDRPEKTAEVFVDNPFDDGEYRPAYRSGDIVRYRCDGEIEFIGRRDGQVKVHGFRIELSEVEAVIREFDGIRDAAVTARDLGAEGKAVAAYVVSYSKVDMKALSEFILERKPAYMLPASIMQIDSIPLTQNGKVNRRALPEPVIEITEEKHEDNALEKELKDIIGKILSTDSVPVNTPLEYAGLTSISTIRLSSALYKRFDINIPVKSFKGITLLGIEDLILENWLSGQKGAHTSSQTASSSPLSAAQTGVYIECMKSADSTAYNIPVMIEFDDGTDVNELCEAVTSVVKAHPSLNVHFDMADGEIRAVRNDTFEEDVPVIEMAEDTFAAYRDRQSVPFRLNKAPLYRFSVIRTEKAVYLFMDIHHLIFDGFSADLFIKELGQVLSGETARGEKKDYFDFVQESTSALKKDAEGYKKYFDSLLCDFESVTELTPDLPVSDRKGRKAYVYGNYDQHRAEEICRKLNVSEAAFLLSALDYTLARLTASDRVYISTISSGRADVSFADTFGMFVNTLSLASSLTNGSISDFVKATSASFDAAVSHESYPFARVAAEWGYSVNIMYEYQRGIVDTISAPHMKSMSVIEPETAKFPVTLRIIDKDGSASIQCEYSDSLYSEKFISEFVRSYEIVIDKFFTDGPLRKVTLIDEAREAQLRSFRMSAQMPPIPDDTFFHTGLERTAAEYPDRMALYAADGTFTYRQFDEMANRAANALLRRASAGDRIVVLMPRISKALFAIYGISKAGMAFIPCDPNYPSDRIRHIIEDSGAPFIITTQDKADAYGDKAIIADELFESGDVTPPDVKITGDDLAYLIYTSGSTGRPKGVMIRHRNAADYMTDHPEKVLCHAMVTDGTVVNSITTLSFDVSVKEYGNALFNGLTVAFDGEEETSDASGLAAFMEKTGADVFITTPSRLMALMDSPLFAKAVSRCRVVVCAGEKFPDRLLDIMQNYDCRLINTYGPTEITVSSNEAELTHANKVTVGRPMPNVMEFIVDSDGNELPAGVIGELYIGGPGVGAGYNGLPGMTAERFTEYKGVRIYKSGDFARWLDNGHVEILGRKDNQIKLRGLRIELDEVDHVLASMKGILRTAVKIDKINGIEHLCAWFTADHEVNIGEMRSEMAKVLTPYMVPTAFMQLDAMPITPNGKLDLKNLPTPELYRTNDGEKAETAAEKVFCEIFSKLLHADNVGVNESFFDLGGTSLLVTNVIIEAGKAGLNITFADVFDNPTPKQLAALTEASDAPAKVGSDVSGYDYTAINELLSRNNIDSFRNGKMREIGDVLLTGAAGYLGVHILHELIEQESGRIYCLLRGKDGLTAAERLIRMYFYYFDTDLSSLIGRRIFVTEGDITDKSLTDMFKDIRLDTVINCAAVVKHFSSSTVIEDVNVGGVINLIGLCLAHDAALIQSSTMSVRGAAYKDDVPEGFSPTEQDLYFRQDLSNKYVYSKFLAERAILEAVAERGLKAKILRYGNLSARSSDGEFQINFSANSAMGRLRAFALLGCATYDLMASSMEFSPIDTTAQVSLALCRTPDECVLFHAVNDQNVSMARVFHELGECGYKIRGVEADEFSKVFADAQGNPAKASELTPLMAYARSADDKEVVSFPKTCDYTMQVLYRMGVIWAPTTWDYIRRFVTALTGLGFFD